MRRLFHRRSLNIWIALGLLLANGLAWWSAASKVDLPEVQPRLDPQIAAIREKLWSGTAAGESFEIVITEQMAAEAIAWFLERHPEVPFGYPQVEIDPGGVTGSGLAEVFGLRTPVHGRASIRLRDGLPVVTIQELGVASATAPDFVLSAIQTELAGQLSIAQRWPAHITRLEMTDGAIIVEGVYK
jgi:hypothetical protein